MYPIANFAAMKEVGKDTNICGYTIPKGMFVTLSNSAQRDPNLVDNAAQFMPERWAKEEVEKRKGTEKEVIDNILFSHPFSFGARQCPGSRLAKLEN